MSDHEANEAIEAINKALENELEGVDVDAITDFKLKRLDRDYQTTIAANIIPEDQPNSPDPGWEADFSDQYYEKCPSDEEEVTEEIPKTYTRDFQITPENAEKIKNIMAKINIRTPYWAKNIPDTIFAEQLKAKIIK
ncbi:hypothetical protein SteCoe_26834 [Stentor coeruleus]|uniref:Uncharacterized protein n=1 Tax=Stentor coeruleus TaxID=5963 RepID=A0A1R2BBY2_9CILI|nr:hypothetical protein SteCoe_26834 [Stentor coeruleus]